MKYYSNFIWEKNGREKNEDSLCFKQITKDGTTYLLAVICDGIGGLAEGENASSFVADSMGREFMRLIEEKGNHKGFLRQIYQCHKILESYGRERNIHLGTTVSMVFLSGRRGWIFHVGDSAVFLGKRRLRHVTGVHHTKKGALKRAVGVGQNFKVEWKRFQLWKGSVILLGSDGFYQKTERDICGKRALRELKHKGKSASKEKEIEKWLLSFYEKGKGKGERDNVSAICVICK